MMEWEPQSFVDKPFDERWNSLLRGEFPVKGRNTHYPVQYRYGERHHLVILRRSVHYSYNYSLLFGNSVFGVSGVQDADYPSPSFAAEFLTDQLFLLQLHHRRMLQEHNFGLRDRLDLQLALDKFTRVFGGSLWEILNRELVPKVCDDGTLLF